MAQYMSWCHSWNTVLVVTNTYRENNLILEPATQERTVQVNNNILKGIFTKSVLLLMRFGVRFNIGNEYTTYGKLR